MRRNYELVQRNVIVTETRVRIPLGNRTRVQDHALRHLRWGLWLRGSGRVYCSPWPLNATRRTREVWVAPHVRGGLAPGTEDSRAAAGAGRVRSAARARAR